LDHFYFWVNQKENFINKNLIRFIFIGPSGVGKTKLAKTLALELFNSSDSMICINMSEYIESHSITRLIGVPPGSNHVAFFFKNLIY